MSMNRFRVIGVWILQFLIAALFVIQAIAKLSGSPAWVSRFHRWGYPEHFYLVVGTVELLAAIALLIPWLAKWGALALIVVMAGATATARRRVRRARSPAQGPVEIANDPTAAGPVSPPTPGIPSWPKALLVGGRSDCRRSVSPSGILSVRFVRWSHRHLDPPPVGSRLVGVVVGGRRALQSPESANKVLSPPIRTRTRPRNGPVVIQASYDSPELLFNDLKGIGTSRYSNIWADAHPRAPLSMCQKGYL